MAFILVALVFISIASGSKDEKAKQHNRRLSQSFCSRR